MKYIVFFLFAFSFGINLKADQQVLPNGSGPVGLVVLDDSWRLWLDEKAEWKNDKIYLPDEVDLTKLPVNPPSGGWNTLSDQAGIPVTLPGTVEEHYWGKKPLPTASPDKPRDIVSLGSSYKGVSWWYRTFTPPTLKRGERLIISFRGARLRSEVYVNGQLVGYNMITEIPFTADATVALKPGGPNQLAVRITSPGGSYSWGDFDLETKWGGYAFPISKGFGGIDGGVTMAVEAPVVVDDLYVANNPDPHTVTLNAEVSSSGPAYKGPLALSISRDGKDVWTGSVNVDLPARGQATVSKQVTVAEAELWDVGHPNLYRASAGIASVPNSTRLTDFGFRWFNAVGFDEKNPRLVLNDRRIFVSSAISWGYWAPNGMFPDKEAAQREVDAVHALGMNCVQNHRHFPKAAALDAFDHAGLLRYCEPGGGSAIWDETLKPTPPPGPIDPSGNGGEPVSFANKYELTKLLAMVKAYRSHPSVIMWSLNNETGASSHNAKMFFAMNKVHELDPSRIVVLKSGFGPDGEIMGRPYVTELFYGEKSTNHDSGWHDNHNEDDTGVYQDSLYNSPTDYKCYTTDNTGIAMWGELGTADSPDDDATTVKWYKEHNVTGYNLDAAQTRLDVYEAYLDKYQFRSAFPTAEALFRGVGARHYFDAAHIVENARISDANDYIALTGWEATTIDNNSGLVDALRHLKSDPALLVQANAPELLVVHARHYVVAKGEPIVADAYIINETNRHGAFTLHFTAALDVDKGKPFFDTTFPVDVKGGDVYSELLKDGISFTAPSDGYVTMKVWLTSADNAEPMLTRTEPALVVDPNPAPITGTIAYADFNGTLAPALQKQYGITAVSLDSAPSKVDAILVSSAGTPRYANPKAEHKGRDESKPGYDWATVLHSTMDRVKGGARLVLMGIDARDIGDAAKVLAAEHLLTYSGEAGFDDTPWVGHWYFCRKHWLLDGLPTDCVLDWQYQPGAHGDGLVMDAPGMEGVIGYGKNPGPELGFGAVVVPVGEGKIIFLAMGGLNDAFTNGDPNGFEPAVARRIIYNALTGK